MDMGLSRCVHHCSLAARRSDSYFGHIWSPIKATFSFAPSRCKSTNSLNLMRTMPAKHLRSNFGPHVQSNAGNMWN